MRNPLTALFGLIALLFLVPSAASAQQSRSAVPDSVHARNHCRLAGQVVRTGQPATKRAWAWAVLPACGSEGGVECGQQSRSGAGAGAVRQQNHHRRRERYWPRCARAVRFSLT